MRAQRHWRLRDEPLALHALLQCCLRGCILAKEVHSVPPSCLPTQKAPRHLVSRPAPSQTSGAVRALQEHAPDWSSLLQHARVKKKKKLTVEYEPVYMLYGRCVFQSVTLDWSPYTWFVSMITLPMRCNNPNFVSSLDSFICASSTGSTATFIRLVSGRTSQVI